MPDFVTLSCPTCGGHLQITKDIDCFACAHCGNEHVVNRGGGIVTLAPVVDGLERIQRGTDRTAKELAIRRMKEELAEAEQSQADILEGLLTEDFAAISGALRKMRKLPRWEFQSSLHKRWRARTEALLAMEPHELRELGASVRERKPGGESSAALETLARLKEQKVDKRRRLRELTYELHD